MDSMGLSKDSILASGNKHIRLSNARNTTIPGGSAVASSNGSSSSSSSSSSKAAAASLQPPVRTRLELNPGPNQFDVQFEQVNNDRISVVVECILRVDVAIAGGVRLPRTRTYGGTDRVGGGGCDGAW